MCNCESVCSEHANSQRSSRERRSRCCLPGSDEREVSACVESGFLRSTGLIRDRLTVSSGIVMDVTKSSQSIYYNRS